MEIKPKITLILSEDDIKNIIVDYLKREGYTVSSENISFALSSVLEGYGLAEHTVTRFNGCIVNCTK